MSTKKGNQEEVTRANSNGPIIPEAPPDDLPEDESPDEGYDPAELRLRQNFAQSVPVKRVLKNVPIRKPSTKTAFIRAHADPNYRCPVTLLELEQDVDRETFLVHPDLAEVLQDEPAAKPYLLVTCISRPGDVVFLMKIRLPGFDGKENDWWRTAHELVKDAEKKWLRIIPDTALGGYRGEAAAGKLAEPRWPDMTFRQILRLATKDRIITTLDHEVLRKLRGEV